MQRTRRATAVFSSGSPVPLSTGILAPQVIPKFALLVFITGILALLVIIYLDF